MGKSPAAIIIARHGTRLDATDKHWQSNSERPYDTPLSYSGWIQCQTLGARVAKELQKLDNQTTPDDLNKEDLGLEAPHHPKRRKVVIHTSPYLRCVQTSIAIAAGLRYPQNDQIRPLTTVQRSMSKSSMIPDRPSPTSAPQQPRKNSSPTRREPTTGKCPMRIDPFLGEWLSPTYFEQSKPPPASEVMVEAAKQGLKVPAEDIRGADIPPPSPIDELHDPLDGENRTPITTAPGKVGLRAMAAAGHSLPHRTRTTSMGRDLTNHSVRMPLETRRRSRANSYSPPVPTYSLAPHDPIPIGYVAHARDACLDIDYDWDSEKLGWGNGGDYGEEWSAMHRRFRTGLQKMITYYEEEFEMTDEEDDDDTELVLIMVTHQAGANALIRLLTGAPALHDVGTGSLTLAVRRPAIRKLPSLDFTSSSPLGTGRLSRRTSRRGSLDIGIADDYEMKIIASTEHLRGGSNPLGLNSPRLGQSPAFTGRRLVGPDSPDGFSIGDPLAWRSSSATGIGRSSSQRSHATDSGPKSRGSTGLWGSPAQNPIDEDAVLNDFMPLSPKSRPVSPDSMAKQHGEIPEIQPLGRSNTMGHTGLWGGGGMVRSGSGTYSRQPPRRSWTVDQSG